MTKEPLSTILAALSIVAGCTTVRPAPAKTPGAGSAAPSPPRLTVETTPTPGSKIALDTHIRVVADYFVQDLQPGRDQLSLFLKTKSGAIWSPSMTMLSKTQDRVSFELLGANLIKRLDLVRPIEVLVVMDRFESAGNTRTLRSSPVITFEVEGDDKTKANPNFVPPQIGRGQLLSDMRDPRYRPHLPPALNVSGAVYWGIFKLCVDTDGTVYSVTMLKSAHALVDSDWMTLLRTLQHRPYSIDGKLVPYCYPLRLEVRATP